jgi:GNAT superfamily N-acetyltransferase
VKRSASTAGFHAATIGEARCRRIAGTLPRPDGSSVLADRDRLEDDGVADAPTYVAQREATIVGMVTLCVFRTLTGTKAYLDHLVVAPEWRRRGIGRALYQSLGFQQRDTDIFRLHIAGRRTDTAAPD